jgi:hypothetical protein
MAEVVQNANSEFWRAPVVQPLETPSVLPILPEVCKQCSAEFVVGAGFCHVCGAQRSHATLTASPSRNPYNRFMELARHLEFHRIQDRVGLPTAALVAFLAGTTCALAAVLVGFIFSANTVLDWQAVQVWRIEWLLGAAAAFLAGIVLKRH